MASGSFSYSIPQLIPSLMVQEKEEEEEEG
jgi:hypothetical protein